jgi:hypothetical protein
MSDAKSSSQKPGRPSTRAMRGRSNSLGSSPNSPSKLSNLSPVVDEILTNIFVPPLPSVDARLSEDLARDKDAKGDDHPQEETAPGRGNSKPPPTETVPDKDVPSRDKDHDADRQYYQRVKQMAQYAIDDCQEFLELYEGVQLNKPLAQKIDADSKVLLQSLTTPLTELSDCDDSDNVAAELRRWKRVIKTFVISMLGRYSEQENVGHPPHSTCSSVPDQQRYAPRNRDRRDVSPSSLNILHRDLVFFMSKLRGDLMPDIAMGIEVSNSELRDLHDFKLPQITKAVDDCRRVLKAYTSASNYDRDIAMEAQERCEDASDWTTDLLERFRMQKLHLDKNGRRREVTFLPFKPGGEVSIYQFMIQFENWSDGFLTEEVKADLLFNKYLDPSITECYTEICLLKENFEEMKKWLIKRYGSVVPIAHACVKSIMRLTKPSESDHPASLQYLRTVHKLLTNLSDLEISKGIPVPKLQSYLGSNAFLSALIETLPPYVHDDLFELLLKSGIDDIDSIEGRQHLRTIIEILKKKFMILELKVKLLPADTSPGSTPAPTTKKYSKPAAGHNQSVVPPTFPVQPASKPPPVYTHSPPLTGGNTTPLGQQRGHSEGGQQSYPRFGRWACPVYYHQGHDVNQCADFWNMGPRDRRTHCKRGACWTCLDKNRLCIGGGCSRIEEVPAELICVECAKSARPGMAPLNVLFCGLADHPKPSADELRKSVEAWIPNLSIQALGAVLRAHITFLTGFNTTMHITPPNPSRSSPQTTNPGGTIYDTSTGKPRTVTAKDTINRTSTDTAFYAMQTLRIRNQDVLVFYDSGSNGHLVDGATAESLKLDVLNTENVPVGGLGDKITWSNYGMYSIILGPDIDGECHELELQGLQTITDKIPDVNLTKLWREAKTVYKDSRPLPAKVGGTPVHILLGLKSTRLSPKLTHTMPSGLGIYESRFYDIYQSNVCFGGPHPIFTQAYHDAGYSINNMEIMFSELARAYLNTPRTFLRVDVDEHGPPLELARELDLVEELTASFPLSHKSSPVPDLLLSEFSDESLTDKITDTDVTGSGLSDTSPDSHDHDSDTDHDNTRQRQWVIFDSSLDHCKNPNCLKSQILLSKLKELQDGPDTPDIVEYRCDSCANCPTCKLSARAKTKSLQEHSEQGVTEKSVHVNLEQERVRVNPPFAKDPVDLLSVKHGAHDNFNQVLRVHYAQCAKQDDVKDQVKKTHQELVDRGHMVKFTDLPESKQTSIKSAPSNHYYPWRAVYKEESVTTPVRLVVDPTMTRLNEILAKRTNMLSKIPEILVRSRCIKYCCNNQLHLDTTTPLPHDDDQDTDITDVQPVPTYESMLYAKEIWFWVKFKFKEPGWERAVNYLRLVLKACTIIKHARHGSPDSTCGKCYLCQRSTSYLLVEVNHITDWMASRHLVSTFPQKRLADKFHKIQGVWYSKSRLEKEGLIDTQDIDYSPFFGHVHIKKMLPVLPVASPIFESYLHYIHTKELPHVGVEATLKRIKERFYPVGNARAAITNFKRQCSKCRLILKETVELELAQFPLVRTIVAPPFWAVQLDIAMSFSAKPTIDSRKTFPCHALIIVCLLTSATDILVLDGLTTQAVVQAIERHAARYGVPAHLFVDSGTQLDKLQDAKFQLRDLQLNTTTHRFQVTVATPKAHQQQGRVEAKIKIMGKMLTAWSKTCGQCNTLIGWETLFARIASAIDDVPIARGSASASTDLGWEIITPNRLKLGRNNYRQLDGPIKLDNCPQTQLERNRLLTCKWYEIFINRIHLLIPPPQRKDSPQPEVGDLVLFPFPGPSFKKLWVWKLGVVEEKISRSSYRIRYSNSDGTNRCVVRAAGQISIIVPAEQLTPDPSPWKVTNET